MARTSTAPEVLRGLGYWFFYGGDKVGPWVGPERVVHVESLARGARLRARGRWRWRRVAVARFRHRGYVALLLLVGVVLSVGTTRTARRRSSDACSALFVDTTSRPRHAVHAARRPARGTRPGLGLGAGAGALAERLPRLATAIPLAAVALLALDMPPLFTGKEYTSGILRDEYVPQLLDQATPASTPATHDTRVYELPGSDFAAYRWGGTVDPITPGLMDRPYVARELVPWGSAPSADLLNAFEERMQDGVFEPAAAGRRSPGSSRPAPSTCAPTSSTSATARPAR